MDNRVTLTSLLGREKIAAGAISSAGRWFLPKLKALPGAVWQQTGGALLGATKRTGELLSAPGKTFAEAWGRLAPSEKAIRKLVGQKTKFQHLLTEPGAPKTLLGILKEPRASRVARVGGESLLGNAAGRASNVASHLSRTGWTGKGRLTRFLPVGGKGLMAAFAAPGAITTGKALVSSEGSFEEGLGSLGGTAGFVAGTGLPILGNMALGQAGGMAGSYVGGKLDRLLGKTKPVPAPASIQAGRLLGRGTLLQQAQGWDPATWQQMGLPPVG